MAKRLQTQDPPDSLFGRTAQPGYKSLNLSQNPQPRNRTLPANSLAPRPAEIILTATGDWQHMLAWNKSTLKSLLVPGGVLFLLVLGLVYSGWLTLALPALSFLYCCALVGGMLLAWRFHSSRIFLSLCVLFIAQ